MSALPPEWQAFFAVSAFVLSLILARIKGYEFSLDRMRVKVRAHPLTFNWDPKEGDYVGFKVEIVNAGRRVAYVVGAGVQLKPGPSEPGLESLPGLLNFDIGTDSLQLLEWQRKGFIFRIPPSALDGFPKDPFLSVTLSNGKTIKAPFRAFSKAQWDAHLKASEEAFIKAAFPTGGNTGQPI